jgi:hypothetical protein
MAWPRRSGCTPLTGRRRGWKSPTPVLLTDTGTDSYLRLAATGASSGQRQWRAGAVNGNYTLSAGNDAANTWTTLAHGTSTAGVANGWYWGTGVSAVDPLLSYQTSLGNDIYKYLSLSAAELKVGTIVAQDYIATIGGRVLVGPTTMLAVDLASGDTQIQVEHNEIASGDRLLMEGGGKVEFMAATSGPTDMAGSALTLQGSGANAGTTVTIPTHTTGDLILIIAYRTAVTAPSLPGGYTDACNASGNSTSMRVGYKEAASGSETSGTWTNATHLIVHVYRGWDNAVAPACTTLGNSGSTTLRYPALTLTATDGLSWVIRAAGASAATATSDPGGSATLIQSVGSAPMSWSYQNTGVTSDPTQISTTVNVSGAQRGVVIEVRGSSAGGGPYRYDVTRNLDGTGANDWYAGDAVFNTGTTGDGFWDIYSIQSVKGGSEAGPTMCANERTSSTYNAWSARFCAGNLHGLYGNAAASLYGVAFGNYSDVWGQMDSTNGLRFFEGSTNQKLRIDPTGYVLLGTSGSGQANTYIDNTSLKLRRGTVDYAVLDSSGLLLGLTSGSEANAQITTSALNLRRGTTTMAALTSGGLYLYDNAGTERASLTSAAGLVLGLTSSGNGNVYADLAGNITLRSGSVARIKLGATNGDITLFDDDGTNARLLVNATGIIAYDQAAKPYFYIDTSNGLILGDWNTANKPFIQATPAGSLQFCRGSGGACTLVFDGSTGNITSTGAIELSTGGDIKSAGNFSLTAANGLRLEPNSATSYSAPKGISWGSSSNGSGIWASTDATGNRLILSVDRANSAGLSIFQVSTDGAYVALNAPSGAENASFIPAVGATHYIGDASNVWDRVYATDYYAGTTIGASQTLTVRNSAGSGTCTITVSGGLITGSTC